MSSTADERSRSLSNVGLPRTNWESLFWTVFAASENPMAIVDANRRVVSANGALQRLLSRAEEDVVGRSIDQREGSLNVVTAPARPCGTQTWLLTTSFIPAPLKAGWC